MYVCVDACVCVCVSGVSRLHYLILSLHNLVLFLLLSEGSCLTEVIQLIIESNEKVQEAVRLLKSGPVTPDGISATQKRHPLSFVGGNDQQYMDAMKLLQFGKPLWCGIKSCGKHQLIHPSIHSFVHMSIQ